MCGSVEIGSLVGTALYCSESPDFEILDSEIPDLGRTDAESFAPESRAAAGLVNRFAGHHTLALAVPVRNRAAM